MGKRGILLTRSEPHLRPVVIVDFDGTVADSFGVFVELLNELAPWWRYAAVDPLDIPEMRELETRALLKFLRISWWKVPFLARVFRKEMRARAARIPLVPGMSEALWAMHEAGWWIDIVSSNSEVQVREFWAKYQLPPTGEGVFHVGLWGKKAALQHLIHRNNWPLEAVAYLGDESRDVLAAQAAGIQAWACTWGYAGPKILESKGPDRLVSDPAQLVWGASVF